MILFDATYINSSGGKVLLEYYIDSLFTANQIDKYLFLFDRRLNSECFKLIPKKNIYFSRSSEFGRRSGLKRIFSDYSIRVLFCFANVPPPFKFEVHCPVYIYFHNILLIEPWSSNHSFKVKFFLYLKSIYIINNLNRDYTWIVQSSLVKTRLQSFLSISSNKILVLPFFESTITYFTGVSKSHQYFYPAEGVAQKNHILLLKVWEQLSQIGIRPKLILTIDKLKFPKLHKEIERLRSLVVNIENIGFSSRSDVIDQYNKSEFLIFPSLNESFGLPLIEATELGCYVIAPDLDYVNILIETDLKFDVKGDELFEIIYRIETSKIELLSPRLKIKNEVESLIQLINQ